MAENGKRVVSCGAVVYRMESEPIYLLLQYTARHWDLPKGHQEGDETEEETTRREVEEETGITDISFLPDFRRTIRYSYRGREGRVHKTVVFRVAQTRAQRTDVRLSHEHMAFEWLPFPAALKRLTYPNARAVLEGAHTHVLARRERA